VTMDKPDETLPRLNLPLQPPVEPMLAQLTRDMPSDGGWLRWRPDKPPEQCTFEQLAFAVPIELEEIFELRGKCLA